MPDIAERLQAVSEKWEAIHSYDILDAGLFDRLERTPNHPRNLLKHIRRRIAPAARPETSEMADRARSATINRDTNETKIQLSLNLDGGALEDASDASTNGEKKSHAAQISKSQTIDIDTGIGFLDHMLHALAKHAGWSLRLRCRGDLHSA